MSRRLIAICVAVLAVFGAAVAAYAAVIDSSGVIHGCYSNGSYQGQHVLTLTDGTCPNGATPISWNQVGQQGPQGAAGPAGPAGQQGPQGPSGFANVYAQWWYGQASADSSSGFQQNCNSGDKVLGGGFEIRPTDTAPAYNVNVEKSMPVYTNGVEGWYVFVHNGNTEVFTPGWVVVGVYAICAKAG